MPPSHLRSHTPDGLETVPAIPPDDEGRSGVELPDFAQQPAREAVERLRALGCTAEVVARSAQPGTELGTVLAQDPPAGTHVRLGAVVALHVAQPPAEHHGDIPLHPPTSDPEDVGEVALPEAIATPESLAEPLTPRFPAAPQTPFAPPHAVVEDRTHERDSARAGRARRKPRPRHYASEDTSRRGRTCRSASTSRPGRRPADAAPRATSRWVPRVGAVLALVLSASAAHALGGDLRFSPRPNATARPQAPRPVALPVRTTGAERSAAGPSTRQRRRAARSRRPTRSPYRTATGRARGTAAATASDPKSAPPARVPPAREPADEFGLE
jgi:hypothetical protein